MRKFNKIIALSSYVALACGAMQMTSGCGTSDKSQAASTAASIEIRFQDDGGAAQSPSGNLRRASGATVADAAPTGPARWPADQNAPARPVASAANPRFGHRPFRR